MLENERFTGVFRIKGNVTIGEIVKLISDDEADEPIFARYLSNDGKTIWFRDVETRRQFGIDLQNSQCLAPFKFASFSLGD